MHDEVRTDTSFDHAANERRFHRTLLIGSGVFAAVLAFFALQIYLSHQQFSMVVIEATVVSERDAANEPIDNDYIPEIEGAMVRLRFRADIELERHTHLTHRLSFGLSTVGEHHELWSGPVRRVRALRGLIYEVYVPVELDPSSTSAKEGKSSEPDDRTGSCRIELSVGGGLIGGLASLQGAAPAPLALMDTRLVIL